MGNWGGGLEIRGDKNPEAKYGGREKGEIGVISESEMLRCDCFARVTGRESQVPIAPYSGP